MTEKIHITRARSLAELHYLCPVPAGLGRMGRRNTLSSRDHEETQANGELTMTHSFRVLPDRVESFSISAPKGTSHLSQLASSG